MNAVGVLDSPTKPVDDVAAMPVETLQDSNDNEPRGEKAVTAEMVAEEAELNKVSEQEELTLHKQNVKEWREMEASERQERYRKLNCLLYKSNRYTEYLISRIKVQQEADEAQKAAQREKREKLMKQREAQRSSQQVVTDPPPMQRKSKRRAEKRNTDATTNVAADDENKNKPRGEERNGNRRGCKRRALVTVNGNAEKRPRGKSPTVEKNAANAGSKKHTLRGDITDAGLSDCVENSPNERGQNSADESTVEGGIRETTDLASPQHGEDDGETRDKEARYFQGQRIHDDQPELFTGGVLRSYQLTGYRWLKTLYANGVNGILADEMGLGKTAQTIATLCYLIENNTPGPYMVCAPLSTLTNWVAEFNRFAPEVPVILYHGDKKTRSRLRALISRRHRIGQNGVTRPVIVTSYEIAIRDKNTLRRFVWKYLVVDEGQRIKNTNCLLVKNLRMYPSTNRLLLTGTPLQNNLSELWSLLNFLLPEIFDDLDSFNSWFDIDMMTHCDDEVIAQQAQRENVLGILHQILSPFMLRRLKTDVELFLPPKKELMVFSPLVPFQYRYYSAIVNKSLKQLDEIEIAKQDAPLAAPVELNLNGRPTRKVASSKVNYNLLMDDVDCEQDDTEDGTTKWFEDVMQLNKKKEVIEREATCQKSCERNVSLRYILMQLRKVCNHPYLIEYPLTDAGDYLIDENIVTSCGKMIVLDRMLTQLKARGHRVLIFSQMTRMLDLLEDYCGLRSFTFCRLDGSTVITDRHDQIADYNNDPSLFLFLLSTRAGGLGINLTGADTVIIYDSDWNPQVDMQAQDRCHRIGQTNPVMVYRFVTSNTVDQTIVERAAGKRKLEKMIIQNGKFCTGVWNANSKRNTVISQEELLALLRATDHSGVVEGRGDEAMSDDDLERLLDRSELYEKWRNDTQAAKNGENGNESSKITGPSKSQIEIKEEPDFCRDKLTS